MFKKLILILIIISAAVFCFSCADIFSDDNSYNGTSRLAKPAKSTEPAEFTDSTAFTEFTENTENTEKITIYEPATTKAADVTETTETAYCFKLRDKYGDVINAIIKGLENIETGTNVEAYSLSIDEIVLLRRYIMDTNPQFFYIALTYSYTYNPDTGKVNEIKNEYIFSETEIKTKKAELEIAVNRAVAAIPNNISDAEKVLAVNEYIACLAVYDENGGKNSAYDLLVGGTARCEGYSRAMQLILSKFGIESILVRSERMIHAWNLVKINGKWYHVDVTWNDPSPDELGRVGHNYLLLSDSVISDSEHEHYNWNGDGYYPAANDDTYKNAFWKQTNSNIVFNNGKWHYIFSDDWLTHNIIAYEFSTGKSSVIYSYESKWNAGENSFWQRSSFLAGYNNYLYYNTADAVWRIDFNGGGKTEIANEIPAGNEAIYEMCIKDGRLYYRIRTAPAAQSPDYREKTKDLN